MLHKVVPSRQLQPFMYYSIYFSIKDYNVCHYQRQFVLLEMLAAVNPLYTGYITELVLKLKPKP